MHFTTASVSLLSIVPALALAQNTAPTEPPKEDLKVSLRLQGDLLNKNLNDSGKSLKQPKLETLRVKIDKSFGATSAASVELRPNELEKAGKWTGGDATSPFLNSDFIKLYNITYKCPMTGMNLSWAREIDTGAYGYTDAAVNNLFAGTTAFTGHVTRIEGLRVDYAMPDMMNMKVRYNLARDQEVTLSRAANYESINTGRTYYHHLTGSMTVAGANVELGVGGQGVWLPLTAGAAVKNDTFVHAVAEYPVMPDWKVKAALGMDSYAVAKTESGTVNAANNKATTLILATRYELMPKTLVTFAEYDMRSVTFADKVQTDYSSTTTIGGEKVDSVSEHSLTVGAQYYLDSKLSVLGDYSMYMNNRHASNAQRSNMMDLNPRARLDNPSDRAATAIGASSESLVSVRVRYDY